jgi:hypothetical protein
MTNIANLFWGSRLNGVKIVNQKLTIAISLTLAIGSTAVFAPEGTETQRQRTAENAIEEVLVRGRASKQIGEAPLVEDKSIAHESTTIVNAGVSREQMADQVSVSVIKACCSAARDRSVLFGSPSLSNPTPAK